jgi:hypothetical protein
MMSPGSFPGRIGALHHWEITMKLAKGAVALVFLMTAGLGSAAAHHSMTMYDKSKVVTIDGTVVELRWSNPHVFLIVTGKVNEGGEAATWTLETSAPVRLEREAGWSPNALRPGDHVRVELNPHWEADNRSGRLWRAVIVDTGQELGTQYLDSPRRQ